MLRRVRNSRRYYYYYNHADNLNHMHYDDAKTLQEIGYADHLRNNGNNKSLNS